MFECTLSVQLIISRNTFSKVILVLSAEKWYQNIFWCFTGKIILVNWQIRKKKCQKIAWSASKMLWVSLGLRHLKSCFLSQRTAPWLSHIGENLLQMLITTFFLPILKSLQLDFYFYFIFLSLFTLQLQLQLQSLRMVGYQNCGNLVHTQKISKEK